MTATELTHEVFAQRAEQMVGVVQRLRGELGLNEAITEAMDRYVHRELQSELAHFAEVILLARRQALLQQRIDEDREALHHGHLSHDELVAKGHHYETLRYSACAYNHLLRGLIESCGQYFSRDELMDWLTAVSQGRRDWAKAEVTGAVSEVALHAALQGLPELRGMRYATLEEDLAGYDFVTQWQGKLLTIDAKTGRYPPLAERKHGHRHLEISVPREVISDFRITRHGLDLLRKEVRKALADDAGSE